VLYNIRVIIIVLWPVAELKVCMQFCYCCVRFDVSRWKYSNFVILLVVIDAELYSFVVVLVTAVPLLAKFSLSQCFFCNVLSVMY